MVKATTINLSLYEFAGLKILQTRRGSGKSELIREALRLLLRQEGITSDEILLYQRDVLCIKMDPLGNVIC